MTATQMAYQIKERLTAHKNGAPYFERERTDTIPRVLT